MDVLMRVCDAKLSMPYQEINEHNCRKSIVIINGIITFLSYR